MKGRSIWEIKATASCSWYWKKKLAVRDVFDSQGELEKFKQGNTYKILDGNRFFMGMQWRDRRYD